MVQNVKKANLNHLKCLKESKEEADKLLETFTPSSAEGGVSGETESLTNNERLAYERVIFSMYAELKPKLYDSEMWEKAREVPEIRALLDDLSDIEEPDYDIKANNQRCAKYINLDQEHILSAGQRRFT